VVAALTRVGARVVRTDELGTIIVRTDGRSITLEAEGQRWDISPASQGADWRAAASTEAIAREYPELNGVRLRRGGLPLVSGAGCWVNPPLKR
jgi:hypothetical protein